MVCVKTQRILDSEKVAIRGRVAQVNAEIEQILATEKAAASAVIVTEKAAAAEVTVKESASEEEEQIINRLGAALVDAEIERILEAEKAASQERVAQVDSEIGSDLSTENVTTTPAEIHKTDKTIEKRIGHFIDNCDGTVTDSRNGLIWMRFAIGQTWDGTSCLGKATTYTLNKAMALRHTFAGYDDWRLPTRDELASIVDLNRKNPAINIEAFPQTAGSWFWSSSLNDNDSYSAWSTNFNSGHIIGLCSGYVRGDDNLFVHLVRGGQYVNALDSNATVPVGSTLILPDNNTSISQESAQQSGAAHVGMSNLLLPSLNSIKSPPPEVKVPEVTRIIDSEAVTPFDTKLAKFVQQYDFVFTNELEMLKADDQWFEETTYFMLRVERGVYRPLTAGDLWFTETKVKRGMREDSAKPHEWPLPFLPLEVAKLNELKEVQRLPVSYS